MTLSPPSAGGSIEGLRWLQWKPPGKWTGIRTVDMHTEGEPLRVIVSGFPMPRGDDVLARRRDAMERFDGLRRMLMWEPRGHKDMYGCLVMPPVTGGADFSVLFMHNDGFSTMCGHAIIAVSCLAALGGTACQFGADGEGDTGLPAPASIDHHARMAIDTPAGLVKARASVRDDGAGEATFVNVPSFVAALDEEVDVPGLGTVKFDVAFGGAFYAFVDAGELGLSLTPDAASELVGAGRAVKAAVRAGGEPRHPDSGDLSFLYGVVFTGPAHDGAHHSRHVCVFADGEVDRSPTGTAVSARLAILDARAQLQQGAPIIVESISGGRFTGRVTGRTSVGRRPAIIPEIGGRAFVTGRHEFTADPADPWREGFLVR